MDFGCLYDLKQRFDRNQTLLKDKAPEIRCGPQWLMIPVIPFAKLIMRRRAQYIRSCTASALCVKSHTDRGNSEPSTLNASVRPIETPVISSIIFFQLYNQTN